VSAARVRPGNAWLAIAPNSSPAEIEPANKLDALKEIAASVPADVRYRRWFVHCVNLWAVSTGSSLESILGLKRSGIPSPHRIAYLEARNEQVRIIAASLPRATVTETAERIAAIVHGAEKAPSARTDRLIEDLVSRFPADLPASGSQYFRILQPDAVGTGE